jgi:hypothetical protein
MHDRFRKDLVKSREGLASLDARLDALAATQSTNSAQVATNTSNISTLQSGLSDAESDISTLQSGLSDAESDISTLQSGLSDAESDISTLQSEIESTSYSEDNVAYGEVTHLDEYANGGEVKCELFGRSMVNSVVNGNFADGTTGYTSISGTALAVASENLTLTGDGSTTSPRAYFLDANIIIGDKWFFYCNARVTNAVCDTLQLRVSGSTGGNTTVDLESNPTQNLFYELKQIITLTDETGSLRVEFRHAYADAATANGKVMEVDGNAGVFAINMTALNIESYTEAQMLDLVRSGYFEGLVGSGVGRVKSVGKNLLKDASLKAGYDLSYPFNSPNGNVAYRQSTEVFKIPAGTYTYSSSESIALKMVDIYDNEITSSPQALPYTFTFTEDRIVSFHMRRTDSATWEQGESLEEIQLQLEQSSTATAYEPYKSSQAYNDRELYSTPNGTHCTKDLNTGKYVKRVERYVLESGDITQLDTTWTNFDAVKVLKTVFIGYKGIVAILEKSFLTAYPEYIAEQGSFDSASNVGKSSMTPSSTYFYLLTVPKGTYADLAAAQAALAGTVIHYELDPAYYETNYDQPANLQGTTIYNECALEVVDVYQDKLNVDDTDYPIDSLEEVLEVDEETGAMTPVDISDCTIASGGLSFTYSGATVGKYYWYSYLSPSANFTLPALQYTYGVNLGAKVDSNTDQISVATKMIQDLVKTEKYRSFVANVTLGAVSATTTLISFIAPFDCELVDINIATKDAISANDTNYWTIDVADADSNTIASKTTKETGGEGFSAYTAWNIGALDTDYNRLSAGEVVKLTLTKTASATALAEALATIKYKVV